MRFAVAALAPFALVACYGSPADTLFSTTLADRAAVAPDVTRPAFQLERFERSVGAPETRTEQDAAPAQDEPVAEDSIMAELDATVGYASEQAFVGAAAGASYDVAHVEAAAIELAFAAEVIAQRATEIRSAFSTSAPTDCGCGGCEPTNEPGLDPGLEQELDEAVTLSALGAESVAGINDELNPPSETVCSSGGCHTVCEEVPDPIDEPALQEQIEQATEIAEQLGTLDLG